MAGVTLLSLPEELQRAIFLHLDGGSLACLSDTCMRLRAVADDGELWMKLVYARYRVSSRVIQSRRLQASGGVSWKTLYTQWDSCQRMPMSRISGPSFPAVGKTRSGSVLMWCTVHSSDDCRLINNNNIAQGGRVYKILRMRLIVQNIDPSEQLHLSPGRAEISALDGTRRTFETKQIIVERRTGKKEVIDPVNSADINNNNSIDEHVVRLDQDEFAVIRLHVNISAADDAHDDEYEDVNFELDALEQLRDILLPVTYSQRRNDTLVRGSKLLDLYNRSRTHTLKAQFRQKTILDMYTFINGFWLRQ